MKNTSRIQRIACLAALALAAGAPSVGNAFEETRYKPANSSHGSADGNLVDVQIRVTGASAPLYFRPGQWDRHYFEAFKGKNYSLVVRNTTGRRVGVVIAVDGINVVNGEKSRLANDEPMYVLDPHERAVIRGWRTSLDEVRKFVFVDEERSYAERTGQASGDLGWIRVLSFRENAPVSVWDRGYRGDRDERARRELGEESAPSAPAPSLDRAPMAQEKSSDRAQLEGESKRGGVESNPGTGWGDRKRDPVQRTWFVAESHATDHIVMRYEYASGLRALGIFPKRARLWDRDVFPVPSIAVFEP